MAILDLASMRPFLKITGLSDDVDLSVFMTVVESAWAAEGLPGESRAEVDELLGGKGSVAVRRCPVLTVTAITEGWDAAVVDLATVHIRKDAGVVSLKSGAFLDPVTVSYTWGFATVPPNIKQAMQLLLKHLWETQRGGARRPGSEPEVGAAYTWPNRVLQLAKPYMPAGFA